jgi:beta-glucosidase
MVSVAEVADAVAAAKAADVVVLALGEKAVQSGESASRADPSLPADQLALAQAVLAVGKPTAAVLFHGRPLVLGPLEREAPALLLAWFPGTMGGAAIARTLFGANEPRGRLPITWPRSVGQIPIYHDHPPTGRPATEPPQPYTAGYLDEPASPLFPFGFGLSYTSFAFAPPHLDRATIRAGEKVTASVAVTNTGPRRGTALVELYVHQPVAEISRPVAEFRGFQSVALEPGETKTARIDLDEGELAYWHPHGCLKADPGRFDILTGPDAGTLQSTSLEYRR